MLRAVFQVLATDKDAGKNAEIEYSIKTGRGRGRFHIHPERGMIYSHKPLSAGQEFDLTVSNSLSHCFKTVHFQNKSVFFTTAVSLINDNGQLIP